MGRLFRHLHEHKLILEDEEKLDTDDVKMKVCEICGFLMFINPYYRCKVGCNFSVHKQCAEELPGRTEFSFDSTTHRLSLIPNKLDPNHENDIRCTKCSQICNNFVYSSLGRFRNSYFHPFCVSPKEIKTKHRSHHDHPMTPTYKMISTFCDACGEEDKDHFLSCQVCNYWIHKECASLPSIGMHSSHANHPLILLYSNPFSRQKSYWGGDYGKCKICGDHMPIQNGVYTCQACSYFFHIKCVKSEIKPLTQEESRKHIFYLPPAEEEYEIFPSFIIRKEQQEFNGTTTKRMTPEECHDHPLTSHGSCNDNDKNDDKKMLTILGVCDACVQPISSSCKYYSCSEIGCHFLVHELCATLSSARIESNFPGAETYLLTKRTGAYLDTFYSCDFCDRWCNGFQYQIQYPTSFRPTRADVECASAPRIIKHQSHNHILHLIQSSSLHCTQRQHFSCCTSNQYTYFLYMCITCDFKIHVSCALLPKKVSHEFDDRPLQLVTDHPKNQQKSGTDDQDKTPYFFCEFCEEDIDHNFWFYNCAKCDQLFHVKCIPSVGKFSKFKFGGTIDGLSHPHCDRPLTSVRMLTVGSQTCGRCENKIDGFEDNVAFQCSTCDFWIHFDCDESI